MSEIEALIRITKRFTNVVIVFTICVALSVVIHLGLSVGWLRVEESPFRKTLTSAIQLLWLPDEASKTHTPNENRLIRYGKDLIDHTARYLGPKGIVAPISNGMNCDNCHLDAGTKPFAANYRAVASTYPKFRNRSGTIESIEKRINDCLQRSLNGDTLDRNSLEMRAMVAYITSIGKDVPKGSKPDGVGLLDLPWMTRMADTLQGREHYMKYCASCHRPDGTGVKHENDVEWLYPPLWGDDSYNTAAGLFRISKFAGFIKANMPYGTSHENPVLTDEQAWDIAAFVNSQPRPHRVFAQDWPNIATKPIDHPFGPYADNLTESQHKYGPWGMITTSRNN
jgi:thiosulfate dehydrogenase